jgi:RecQ-mediated genome instability protein 1
MAAQPTLPLLTNSLTSLGLPTPHAAFLMPILTPGPSQRLPPLTVLTATAKHRLLSSEFTQPSILAATAPSFPPRLSDASVVFLDLQADIPVQVLEIEDLSKSKWEQIEALEMERKGEMTKGREVIRVVTEAEGPSTASTQASANTTTAPKSYGPFKLCMQDVKGQKVYGFELKRVEKIGYPPAMCIGCKLMLKRGSKVARGMVLLEPNLTVVLGGKIEELDKRWRERREQALRAAVGERGADAL